MKVWVALLVLLVAERGYPQDQWKNVYVESAWVERDGWQKPDVLIQYLNLVVGGRVADIGCHEGYMTVKLSAAVGIAGRVYAVDVDANKLQKLKTVLQSRKITNVTSIKGEFDNPLLPNDSLDGVIIVDSYHEMWAHDKILAHIKAALKSSGRLVICEPVAEERRKLLRDEQVRRHELGISFALKDLEKAGFKIVFQQDPFVDREKIKGDKMWIIVATPL